MTNENMLTEIIEQLESCGFECEAGRLENNKAFIELKEFVQKVAEYSTPQVPIMYTSDSAADESRIRCPRCKENLISVVRLGGLDGERPIYEHSCASCGQEILL